MLNSFRSFAGSFSAKLLLVLLILSFAVWGVGDMVQPATRSDVASVGGESISVPEFQKELRRESEAMRRALGDQFSPEMLKELQLPEQVLQRMIHQALLAQESTARGLVPPDAAVVRRLRTTPAFQDKNGNFDKALFEAMLKNSGVSEKNYVEQLRREMGADLLINTLLSATPVSDVAARTLLAAREEQRALTLYRLSPSLAGDVEAPDEAQLKAYYQEHGPEFTAPEYRNLSYVVLTSEEALATASVSEEQVKAAYEERVEEFRRPERRNVEQLLYSSQDKAIKALAMLKSGRGFAEVAKATAVLNNTLSLGEIDRGSIIENAAEKVFSLPEGGISEPIQSPFGWHIFRVTKIIPPSTAPFKEVQAQLEKDVKRRAADEILNTKANQLEDALAGGATLHEAAKEQGLKVHSLGPINREGQLADGSKPRNFPPPSLSDAEKFLEAAFNTEEKAESPLLTARGGIYYIVRVDSVTPERLRALDEVRGLVVAGWQKQERQRRLAELAQKIGQQFGKSDTRGAIISRYGFEPLDYVTVKQNSRVARDIPLPPDLVAEAFTLSPGSGTGAYLMQGGDYLLAVVNKIIPAPFPAKDAADLAEMRSALATAMRSEILGQYMRHLMQKYPVTVNEAALEAAIR